MLVLLAISRDEPSLGFDDDPIGKDEVRTVRVLLERRRVPDLRHFKQDWEAKAEELIPDLAF